MDKEKLIDTLNDIKHTLNDLKKKVDNLEFQIEEKKKGTAYLVKDEYSYNCLMKELEEQGYVWAIGVKPTSRKYERYETELVIYLNENKNLTSSKKDWFKLQKKDEFILQKYYKKEPLYYAKIKGWELSQKDYIYWSYGKGFRKLITTNNVIRDGYATIATKSEWKKLGINDSNADFEEVEE